MTSHALYQVSKRDFLRRTLALSDAEAGEVSVRVQSVTVNYRLVVHTASPLSLGAGPRIDVMQNSSNVGKCNSR